MPHIIIHFESNIINGLFDVIGDQAYLFSALRTWLLSNLHRQYGYSTTRHYLMFNLSISKYCLFNFQFWSSILSIILALDHLFTLTATLSTSLISTHRNFNPGSHRQCYPIDRLVYYFVDSIYDVTIDYIVHITTIVNNVWRWVDHYCVFNVECWPSK